MGEENITKTFNVTLIEMWNVTFNSNIIQYQIRCLVKVKKLFTLQATFDEGFPFCFLINEFASFMYKIEVEFSFHCSLILNAVWKISFWNSDWILNWMLTVIFTTQRHLMWASLNKILDGASSFVC